MFFHVFSLSLLNAYIIYKTWCAEKRKQPLKQKAFRRQYVEELITSVGVVPSSETCPGRPPKTNDNLLRLNGQHFPRRIRPVGKKKNISRACVVCGPAERELLSRDNIQKRRPGRESAFECAQCEKALSVDPCFGFYHTKTEYKLAYKRHKAQQEAVAAQDAQD